MSETKPTNLLDFENEASKVLDTNIFNYFSKGAFTESTLSKSRSAFEDYSLFPRILRDVGSISLKTRMGNFEMETPTIASPSALHRLANPEGERATAEAAASNGSGYILSSMSSVSLEEVAKIFVEKRKSGKQPLWLQTYCFKDRNITKDLIQRAERAGYNGICLTVDGPVPGIRYHSPLRPPPDVRLVNLERYLDQKNSVVVGQIGSALTFFANFVDRSLDWNGLNEIRSYSNLELILKGVLHPDDAEKAEHSEINIVMVSNHGGRQLDGAVNALKMLDRMNRTPRRLKFILDGGVRTGSDVLKSLALGASSVSFGRPIVYALAVGGLAGVDHMYKLLKREIEFTLALCGLKDISMVDRNIIDTQ